MVGLIKLKPIVFYQLKELKQYYVCSYSDLIYQLITSHKLLLLPIADEIKRFQDRYLSLADIRNRKTMIELGIDESDLVEDSPFSSTLDDSSIHQRVDSMWFSSPEEKRLYYASLDALGIDESDFDPDSFSRMLRDNHEKFRRNSRKKHVIRDQVTDPIELKYL